MPNGYDSLNRHMGGGGPISIGSETAPFKFNDGTAAHSTTTGVTQRSSCPFIMDQRRRLLIKIPVHGTLVFPHTGKVGNDPARHEP